MSQRNLDLIVGLQPAPTVDLAVVFRNDEGWAALAESFASLLHPEFECVNPGAPGEQTHRGTEGFRVFWLDWLAPWSSYRTVTGRAVDCGDRILVMATNFARPHGATQEVRMDAGSVYRFRDGKIVR